MADENLKKIINQSIDNKLDSTNNLSVPFHIHNGWDSPQLDPAVALLGFPVVQVSNAATAPTDIPINGTFRFQVDTSGNTVLWVYTVVATTTGATAGTYTGTWKALNLSTSTQVPKSMLISRDLTAAGGAVNTAHGLGRTPTFVRLTAQYVSSRTLTTSGDVPIFPLTSVGTYDGTNQKCIYFSVGNAQGPQINSSTGLAVFAQSDTKDSSGNFQTAVVTWDSTNIILTWTKTGSPTGSANIIIEAF